MCIFMSMSEPEKLQFKFLIPAELKASLEKEAHKNRRSLSAEIIQRLQDSLAPSPWDFVDEVDPITKLEDRVESLERIVSVLVQQRKLVEEPTEKLTWETWGEKEP